MTSAEQALITRIAAHYGCIAEVVRSGCQMADRNAADWQRLYDAVTKPEGVEGYEPQTIADAVAVGYGDFDLSNQPRTVDADNK